MSFANFDEFKDAEASEKVALCKLESSKRLLGWTLDSGAIYTIPFSEPIVDGVEVGGVTLVEASTSALSAGEFFYDKNNGEIFIRLIDDSDPNLSFIALFFFLFFSTHGAKLAHDLASGEVVFWEPFLKPLSSFGVQLDSEQIGVAIEGSGSVKFHNDDVANDYWRPRYDKFVFENKRCFIYLWNPDLAATEAKLIYRGRVQGKRWSAGEISFTLKDRINELRQPITLSNVSDLTGEFVPEAVADAKQRRLYGRISKLRPLNIDQLTDGTTQGYLLTGTIALTNASATVTGTATNFLNDFSPGDRIVYVDTNDEDVEVDIESVASDTSLTLTDDFDGITESGIAYRVQPDRPKRYTNRRFLVAGHETRQPETTVASAKSLTIINFVDASDMKETDPIIIGTERVTIEKISGNQVTLVGALVALPAGGTAVTRSSVINVKISNPGGEVLSLVENVSGDTQDFSYDAETAIITLEGNAEFNRTRERNILGTSVTFTTSSRTVTGIGTQFISQLKADDAIRLAGQSDFFFILQIDSDTSLELRTASTYTGTAAGIFKSPNYYSEDGDIGAVLICDVLGVTADGTKEGTFIENGPSVVEDLLKQAGLTDDIDTSGFTTAKALAPQIVGLAIPDTRLGTTVPKTKDLIDQVNRSVFGALIQNTSDFKLNYKVLAPKISSSRTKIQKMDVISFSVKSLSDKVAKITFLEYAPEEWNEIQRAPFCPSVSKTSERADFLIKTNNEFRVRSILSLASDATLFVSRWALIKELSRTIISFKTKLQTHLLDALDEVDFDHPKLFQRFGSNDTKKVGSIIKFSKSGDSASIDLDDLANSFTRCFIIMDAGANSFSEATEDELAQGGFITDSNGLQGNDPDSEGLSLLY